MHGDGSTVHDQHIVAQQLQDSPLGRHDLPMPSAWRSAISLWRWWLTSEVSYQCNKALNNGTPDLGGCRSLATAVASDHSGVVTSGQTLSSVHLRLTLTRGTTSWSQKRHYINCHSAGLEATHVCWNKPRKTGADNNSGLDAWPEILNTNRKIGYHMLQTHWVTALAYWTVSLTGH